MGGMELIHYHFDTLVSTNDWAKKELKTFKREAFTLITAEQQTRGRGQYGRLWVSPKGENLYASFCFFINENQEEPLSLTHVLALSLARVLTTKGVNCRIKWPNDLLINRKKIAGILCETEYLPPYFGVVIGLGLNINMSQETLSTINQPATSLKEETGQLWEIPPLVKEITESFQEDLQTFLKQGFSSFLSDFQRLTT